MKRETCLFGLAAFAFAAAPATAATVAQTGSNEMPDDEPKLRFELIDGLRIRYAASTNGAGIPVLLTSPYPESVLAFRSIWPALSQVAPVVAVDLPGFGQSQSRPDVLNPPAMGDFIVKIVEAFSLRQPHVVAPDVGTSAVLYAAAGNPGLFTSLVVGGGAIDERLTSGSLKRIIEAPDTKAFEGVDGADLASASIARLMQSTPSEDELRDYRASYAGDRFVEAMAYVRDYPRSLPPLRRLLGTIQTPVQIVYGLRDPIVPPAQAEMLHQALPHSRLVPLDCGHLAWQDKAGDYAVSLRSWLGGGYRSA